MDRQRLAEIADGGAACALAVVLTFEVIERGDDTFLRWCNVVLFAVFVVTFIERWQSGAFSRLSTFGKAVEIGLLVVAIPLPAFERAGPVRLMRLIRLPLIGARHGDTLRQQLIDRGPGLVVVGAGAFAYMSALFILEFERGHPVSKIDTLWDGIWWAAATMTTVGYGDLTPATHGGRITAVVVMVVGISVFGLITALLTTWLRGRPGEEPATKADIEALRAMLDDRS